MNIKDLREKVSKKINKQSVKTFFQKQGLYVLIFLCGCSGRYHGDYRMARRTRRSKNRLVKRIQACVYD